MPQRPVRACGGDTLRGRCERVIQHPSPNPLQTPQNSPPPPPRPEEQA